MALGLVLGAGGTVGLSYHAGVLRALHQVAGIDPNSADLIVGTSAGAVAGAYVRSGWSSDDLWALMMGTHESLGELAPGELDAQRREVLVPSFRSLGGLVGRAVGSAYVVSRAATRVTTPRLPAPLGRAFPAGMFRMIEGNRRFDADLPQAWPGRPLWLCTVNLDTGRRVVLGRKAVPMSLPRAVAASCAIPGVYQPVRIGHRTLVDGGVHSITNIDLAVDAGCDTILAVSPLAFDPASGPSVLNQLARRYPTRQLSGELAAARRAGARVVAVRPTAGELRLHGMNLMRRHGWEDVARMAYDAAARLFETDRFREILEPLAA